MLYPILRFLFGWILLLVWWPRVIGRDNLRIKGGAIVVSNHISFWDPVFLAIISPRIIHFMAKKELFSNALGNWFMRALNVFPITRKSGDVGSIKKALSLLEKGKIMGIFPEGTRSLTGDMAAFEKGVGMLTLRSGKPVIPVFIYPRSFKERTMCVIGKPIDVSQIVKDVPKHDQFAFVSDFLHTSVLALQNEIAEVQHVGINRRRK